MTTSTLLNPEEAAKVLGVSTGLLAKWRLEGTGPMFAKLGDRPSSRVRYRREDLDTWVTSKVVTPR
jgi:predicted DNA-binding transcriptional regulator AlpA